MYATVDHMQSDNQESFVDVSYYTVNDGWTVDNSGQTVDNPEHSNLDQTGIYTNFQKIE